MKNILPHTYFNPKRISHLLFAVAPLFSNEAFCSENFEHAPMPNASRTYESPPADGSSPLCTLPPEKQVQIFNYLNEKELGQLAQTSSDINPVATDNSLWRKKFFENFLSAGSVTLAEDLSWKSLYHLYDGEEKRVCELIQKRNFDSTFLSLNKQHIFILPDTIENNFSLQKVSIAWLSDNNLRALPNSMRHMTNLEQLMLFNNKLEFLPSDMGCLSELKILRLQNNNMKSLPESFQKLIKLTELDLADNAFNTVPSPIEKLLHLKMLNMRGNPLITFSKEFFEWLSVVDEGLILMLDPSSKKIFHEMLSTGIEKGENAYFSIVKTRIEAHEIDIG